MVSDPWPPDSLTGLVAKAEAQHKGAYADVPCALAPTGHVGLPLMMQMGGMDNPISPFVVPGSRGMAMRRHSQQGYRRGSLASPPPASRGGGGLNVQANWPSLGRPFPMQGPEGVDVVGEPVAKYAGDAYGNKDYLLGDASPMGKQYLARSPEAGHGKIQPIGIRPSIQSQSAMLREMFPRGGLGEA